MARTSQNNARKPSQQPPKPPKAPKSKQAQRNRQTRPSSTLPERREAAEQALAKLGNTIESGFVQIAHNDIIELTHNQLGEAWDKVTAWVWLNHRAAVSQHDRTLPDGKLKHAVTVPIRHVLTQRSLLARLWQWNVKTVDAFLQELVRRGWITLHKRNQKVLLIEVHRHDDPSRETMTTRETDAVLDEVHQSHNQQDATSRPSEKQRRKVAGQTQSNLLVKRKSTFAPEKPGVNGEAQRNDWTNVERFAGRTNKNKSIKNKKENTTHTRKADFLSLEEDQATGKEKRPAAGTKQQRSTGQVKPSPSGQVKPHRAEQVKRHRAEQVKPSPSGQVKPHRDGQKQPSLAESGSAARSGQKKVSPTEQVKPSAAGVDQAARSKRPATAAEQLTGPQLVEQFNALPGTVPARYSSVIEKKFTAQCQEYPDLPQLLADALQPRYWPLLWLCRDVDLLWLLDNEDAIAKIPTGKLSQPRPQRSSRGEDRAATTSATPAGRRVIDPQPIDPRRWLVMPAMEPGTYWDGGLRFSELVVYDQRQLELIRHLNCHLLAHDERFGEAKLASLVLSGPSGTGKDLLLYRLAESAVDLLYGSSRNPRNLLRGNNGLEHIEARSLVGCTDWEVMSKRYDAAREADLLVLSDPEQLGNNRWHRERLSSLLQDRYDAGKPTWVSTNCPTLASLTSAINPPPDQHDRSPLERRLVLDPAKHFIRIEWPPYDRVQQQLDAGELPSVLYGELVLTDEQAHERLAELSPARRKQRERRYEWLPRHWAITHELDAAQHPAASLLADGELMEAMLAADDEPLDDEPPAAPRRQPATSGKARAKRRPQPGANGKPRGKLRRKRPATPARE